MADLRPCPFCGSTNAQLSMPFPVYVWCVDCETYGPSADSKPGAESAKKEAARLWNTRPGEDARDQLVRDAILQASDMMNARKP